MERLARQPAPVATCERRYRSRRAAHRDDTGAGQNLSAEAETSHAPVHDRGPVEIQASGALRLTSALDGAPITLGPDLIRRVHPFGTGSALEVIGMSEHLLVLEDPATINHRRAQAVKEARMYEHPDSARAESRVMWDDIVVHMKAAMEHAADALDALRSAYTAARSCARTGRSTEADIVVDRKLEADVHLRSALKRAEEALPTPAPRRTHAPDVGASARKLTYTPPAPEAE